MPTAPTGRPIPAGTRPPSAHRPPMTPSTPPPPRVCCASCWPCSPATGCPGTTPSTPPVHCGPRCTASSPSRPAAGSACPSTLIAATPGSSTASTPRCTAGPTPTGSRRPPASRAAHDDHQLAHLDRGAHRVTAGAAGLGRCGGLVHAPRTATTRHPSITHRQGARPMPSRRQKAAAETSGIRRAASMDEPSYGLDAPPVVAGYAAMGLLGVAFLLLTALTAARLLGPGLVFCVVGWGTAALLVHSSLRGKRLLRDRVLDGLAWRGDEDIVDLGTGRGLMLLGAALRAPQGSATGIDLWRSVDQAGSRPDRLLANAAALGVADRIRVVTGDMSVPQLPDASADLVLACLSIHNIHDRAKRRAVIDQAARMLRPGGSLAIVDFAKTAEYVADARAAGLVDVCRSGPTALMWPPVRVVTARKPTA